MSLMLKVKETKQKKELNKQLKIQEPNTSLLIRSLPFLLSSVLGCFLQKIVLLPSLLFYFIFEFGVLGMFV